MTASLRPVLSGRRPLARPRYLTAYVDGKTPS